MPYTKDDYPNTMKNLDNDTRLKAIDILNAMLEEGYKEENAIPISISQAKEWVKNASDKDLKDLKKKDITKHDQEGVSSARLQDSDVIVFYDEVNKKWAVKSEGAKRISEYFDTKKEAEEKGKYIANNKDSDLKVYKKNETPD